MPEVHATILDDSGGVACQLSALWDHRPLRAPPRALSACICEPDPAIIRAGLAPVLAAQMNLSFVNTTTDYLSSPHAPAAFPGRVLAVQSSMAWQRQEVRRYLKQHGITRATVWRRDFAASPRELRVLLGIGEGAGDVLIFTRDAHGAPLFIHAIPLRGRETDETKDGTAP